MKQEHFEKLFAINVNEHTEEKNKLTYLTWSWAWAELKKIYPSATYEIERYEGLPYVFDEKTGYMVFTKVTIEDITHEMWLPVMNEHNKAMKNEPYEYTIKTWDDYQKKYVPTKKTCQVATMFDINKTIMRCLVKNLAMFGLGLYIYAGEDLPESVEENTKESKKAEYKKVEDKKATPGQLKVLEKVYTGELLDKLLKVNKLDKLEDMTFEKAKELINKLEKKENK